MFNSGRVFLFFLSQSVRSTVLIYSQKYCAASVRIREVIFPRANLSVEQMLPSQSIKNVPSKLNVEQRAYFSSLGEYVELLGSCIIKTFCEQIVI